MTAFARAAEPIARWATRLDRRTVVPIGIILVALVGLADYTSGVEPTFTLLYVFPVALGVWFRSRSFGILLGALSTVCQGLAAAPHHVLVAAWNAIASFGIFLVITWLVGLLHEYVERERNRLHIAVAQLRHAERLNVIGTLAAGVAHEIGTPLSVISLSANRLDDPRVPRERAHQLTQSIVGQCEKISAIVRHLLEFGRRSTGGRAEVELGALARRTIEMVSSAAHRYRCTIGLAAEAPEVPVVANASELEQVLSNLLLNAMQAMPRGGEVGVALSVVERQVADGSARPFAALQVADQGTGISEADLPHIFDPFFTTKPPGEGTGLGLSVSYGIVSDHGGTIEVESRRGHGTTFTVLLPLAA